jgi:hypothetical protein
LCGIDLPRYGAKLYFVDFGCGGGVGIGSGPLAAITAVVLE